MTTFCVIHTHDCDSALSSETLQTLLVQIKVGASSYIVGRFKEPLPSEVEKLLFPGEIQKALKSCWEFFLPPLVLASVDVKKRHHRNSRTLGHLSLESLRRDFVKAVNFYLRPEQQRRFLLTRVSKNINDPELRENFWLWVVGYQRRENSPCGEERALVINLERELDLLPVDYLDVSRTSLLERFPYAPPGYGLSGKLPPDFCPGSLT